MTIDQEDLDFEFSASVDIRAETKSSTEFSSRAEKLSTEYTSRTNQDEDNIKLDKMMNRVTMNEEVDIDSVDIGSMPIFENSRHIEQMPLDNDFPLWAGDTSARRSPEGELEFNSIINSNNKL